MTRGYDRSKGGWRNRLAPWRAATKVPFVKDTIFTRKNKGKCNKMDYVCMSPEMERRPRAGCWLQFTLRRHLSCDSCLQSGENQKALEARSHVPDFPARRLSPCPPTGALSQASLRADTQRMFVDMRIWARVSDQFSLFPFVTTARI